MHAVDIEVLQFAEVPTPHAYILRPEHRVIGGAAGLVRPSKPPVVLSCLAYIVRHPDAGPILIDTGLHPRALKSVSDDFGGMMGTLFSKMRPTAGAFDAQLREAGVEPADISTVVMTHLHVDHTSGMRLLPRAKFVVATDEWRAANGPRPFLKGYVPDHLPPAERVILVDVSRDGERFGPFEKTVDLLGDGSIRLLSTPGHTRGHLSALMRLKDGRPLLVVGDAAYTMASIEEQRLPLFTDNDDQARRSLEQLKAFAAVEPNALLVPSHDPTAWRQLAAVST